MAVTKPAEQEKLPVQSILSDGQWVAGKGGKPEYEVEFHERRLEEIKEQLNRLKRKDEAAFEAVAKMSDFNQTAYELFARPWVQATSNEASAKLLREFHPLRAERAVLSDANPWLAWVGPVAEAVREQRAALVRRHAQTRGSERGTRRGRHQPTFHTTESSFQFTK